MLLILQTVGSKSPLPGRFLSVFLPLLKFFLQIPHSSFHGICDYHYFWVFNGDQETKSLSTSSTLFSIFLTILSSLCLHTTISYLLHTHAHTDTCIRASTHGLHPTKKKTKKTRTYRRADGYTNSLLCTNLSFILMTREIYRSVNRFRIWHNVGTDELWTLLSLIKKWGNRKKNKSKKKTKKRKKEKRSERRNGLLSSCLVMFVELLMNILYVQSGLEDLLHFLLIF